MSKINKDTDFMGKSRIDSSEPDDEEREMFDEVKDIMAHPEKYRQYDAAEEMMKDILSEADQDAGDNM